MNMRAIKESNPASKCPLAVAVLPTRGAACLMLSFTWGFKWVFCMVPKTYEGYFCGFLCRCQGDPQGGAPV